jgi:hypothetical protein
MGGGIQDKKNTLDNFYKDYADWNITEKDKIEREFIEILKDIHLIFNEKEYTGLSINNKSVLKFSKFLFSILCPNLFNLLIAKNKA